MTPTHPPIAGTVLRYRYLWARQTTPDKDRPVVLVVARGPAIGDCIVVPITHTEPEGLSIGIEVPPEIRRRLGLDDERQWVVLTELNTFRWPGPDLREVPGREPETCVYGTLPRAFFQLVFAQMQTLLRARRMNAVGR